MRRPYLLLLLMASLYPGVARAQVKVSVFDLEGGSGAAKVATRITRAMRRQVGAKSSLAIVPGKSLAEIKLVFGCPDRPIAAFHKCLAQVGVSLKADKILLGRVRHRRGTYKVVLTLLDVRQPLRPSTLSVRLAPAETRGTALARNAAKWLAALLGLKVPPGRLSLLCGTDGVTVHVDGKAAGTCGQVERTLSLKPGTHEVRFSKDGFESTARTVTILQGQTSRLNVTLRARPVGPGSVRQPPGGEGTTPPVGDQPRRGDPRLKWKVLFYSTLGVGAALLVSSIVTGLKVKSLEDEKEGVIRDSFDGPPSGWITEQNDVCAHPNGNAELIAICDDGKKYAAVTNALIGVGAALVAGSGYFLYRAYFARDAKEQPATGRPATPTPSRFVLTPQIWERGGGVSATLRF